MSVKKRSNPGASPDNTFNLHTSEMGCCDGDNLTTCQYRADIDYAETIDNIIIKVDDVNTTVQLNLPANSTKKELRIAVANALKTHGYDPHYAMDNIIGVATTGNELVVTGEAELVSISIDATPVVFSKFCTQVKIVHTEFADVDTTSPFGIFKLEGQTGADLGEFVGDHSSDVQSVIDDIEAALTADGVKWNRVEATLVGTLITFNIYANAESSLLSLDGVVGTKIKVYPGYVN